MGTSMIPNMFKGFMKDPPNFFKDRLMKHYFGDFGQGTVLGDGRSSTRCFHIEMPFMSFGGSKPETRGCSWLFGAEPTRWGTGAPDHYQFH